MPYITIPISPKAKQLTFDNLWAGFKELDLEPAKDTHDTRTYFVDVPSDKVMSKLDKYELYNAIAQFNKKYAELEAVDDKSTLYRHFEIPKRSGGWRKIDAPHDELATALRELKTILEKKFYASHHTIAFAYVKGRSTIDAVKRHQKNESRWILKMDMSKFFPSTTKEFLLEMIYKSFPFSELKGWEAFENEFSKALELAFLNGGLPQGTPISPMLTNMMMIPIDFELAKMAREHHPHLCITRYADDIHISSEYSFMWTKVQFKVMDILKKYNAPFSLNKEKTHYGSRSGRNWMLGVMYNKDGDITVGAEKKKYLKAALFNFANDVKAEKKWELEDLQILAGKISYFKMVEPEPIKAILNKYAEKFGFDIEKTLIQKITDYAA